MVPSGWLPRAHARLEALLGVDDDVAQARPVDGKDRADRLGQQSRLGQPQTREAVCRRDGDVVGQLHAARPALADQAREEVLLGAADRQVAAVVQDEDLDRPAGGDQGLHLLDVHLQAAVAGQADDGRPLVERPVAVRLDYGGGRTQRGRQVDSPSRPRRSWRTGAARLAGGRPERPSRTRRRCRWPPRRDRRAGRTAPP